MKSYLKISFILVFLSFSHFISFSAAVAHTDNQLLNDSIQIIGKQLNQLTDNQPVARISLPGKNMIKRADNEMHRNMKSDLAGYKLLNHIDLEITDADNLITNEFYKSFQLSIGSDVKKSDLSIDYIFKAENIKSSYFMNLQEIDNQINKRFYSSN
jgi:hypothetical protein